MTGTDGDGSCSLLSELVHCRNCPTYCKAGRALFDREVPENYTAEWTKFFAAETEARNQTGLLVLVFRLKQEWLALPVSLLKQVCSPQKPHRIPHSRGILVGLVNVEGQLNLCVSLEKLLQLEESENVTEEASKMRDRMILIDSANEVWAFHVDDIFGTYRLGDEDLQEVPVTLAKSPTRHTRGVFTCDDKVVALLDEELLFSGLRRSVS